MRALVLRAFVPLLLVFASCREGPTEPIDGLRVTTSLSSATLRAGESVTITVTATNTSPRTVSIQGNTCPKPFEVLQGAEVVAPGGRLCTAISIPIDVAPGASHTFMYQWAGDRRQDDPARSATIQLAPGSYTVRGIVSGSSREVIGNAVALTIAR